MQVINMQDWWRQWQSRLLAYLPRYDPYGELASLPRAILGIQKDGFTLLRKSRVGQPLAAQPKSQTAASLANIASLIQKSEEIVISVSSGLWFSRQLILPRNALPRIEQILDLEVAAVTPFARQDVYSGWIVRNVKAADASLDIEHILIKKSLLSESIEALRQRGARPIGIIVNDDAGRAKAMALSIEGGPFFRAEVQRWRRFAAFGLGLVLLTAGASATILLFRQNQVISQIETQSVAVESTATEVRQKLDVIKHASSEVSGLLQRKSATPSRVAIIEELTRLLPDSAFLDGLAIEPGRITIEGSAASPERLIAGLESSAMFRNVAFAAPVFKNPTDIQAHFSIRLELEPKVKGLSP